MGIQQFKADIAFRSLMEGMDENLYVIPKYQRKYRWTKKQAVCLAESLICGLPIPPIYTCRNKNNQLEILDGQQRMISLFFYYIGKCLDRGINKVADFSEPVMENESFREALERQCSLEIFHVDLEDSEGNLINMDYAGLPLEQKRIIDYTTITVVEIKINEEAYRFSVIRKIFANLNAGGTVLTKQELRNGIYTSPFYEMLWDINKHNRQWRMIWGRESDTEEDMAFLLRLCMLKKYVHIKQISGSDFDVTFEDARKSEVFVSFDDQMDQFSDESCYFEEGQIEEYKNSLLTFFELFKGDIPMYQGIVESFYIVFEKLYVRKPITFVDCETIHKDDVYNQYNRIEGWFSSIVSMKGKWKRVYEIWAGVHAVHRSKDC